ncbi:ATP-grasp domain-containing protein [Candidatus Beckwithbacteria bacterium]|nr:ATP-grasp domain-containing protein [Candidatus Beckwithbacteria bacterium]
MIDSAYQKTLQDFSGSVVGIGVTAFNRIGPSFFLPSYQIICAKKSSDLPIFKDNGIAVQSVEGDFGKKLRSYNSLEILRSQAVQDYLNALPQPVWIYLYRSSANIEEICDKQGWQVLTNRSHLRDKFENKKYFRQLLKQLNLPLIKGKTIALNELKKPNAWQSLVTELGDKLVFQLTEMFKGGGIGTTFVFSQTDFEQFLQKVTTLKEERELSHVNVVQFIQGFNSSITGCVTKYGILHGPVQTQIIDQIVSEGDNKHGRFCGHDWSFKAYSENVQNQANQIVTRFGEHLAKEGYKGIFGLDLMIDQASGTVYSIECNPRYTGAFPVYTMLSLEIGETPFDVFHLMEHLDLEYEVDIETVNRTLQQAKSGAHLVLHNRKEEWVKVGGHMPAGVCTFDEGNIVWLRPGFKPSQIQADNEFIFTDGCPHQGDLIKPGLRFGKLIFNKGILDQNQQLQDWTKQLVEKFYQAMGFEVASGS